MVSVGDILPDALTGCHYTFDESCLFDCDCCLKNLLDSGVYVVESLEMVDWSGLSMGDDIAEDSDDGGDEYFG